MLSGKDVFRYIFSYFFFVYLDDKVTHISRTFQRCFSISWNILMKWVPCSIAVLPRIHSFLRQHSNGHRKRSRQLLQTIHSNSFSSVAPPLHALTSPKWNDSGLHKLTFGSLRGNSSSASVLTLPDQHLQLCVQVDADALMSAMPPLVDNKLLPCAFLSHNSSPG